MKKAFRQAVPISKEHVNVWENYSVRQPLIAIFKGEEASFASNGRRRDVSAATGVLGNCLQLNERKFRPRPAVLQTDPD